MDHATLINEKDKTAIVLRLKRVEGQLRGVQQLIEGGASCDKIAQQLSAARHALDKAFGEMLGCIVEAKLGEVGADAGELRELLSRYG